MRAVIELAGIKDVVAKSRGTSNKLNVAKATMKALEKLNQEMIINPPKSEKIEGKKVAKKEIVKKSEKQVVKK